MRKENHEPRKRERSKRRQLSFRLNAPENAVTKLTVPILLQHGTPTISAEIRGMPRNLILDTGSNISIMQPGISRSNVQVTMPEPYGVTGDVLDIRGQQSVTFLLNGIEFTHSFLVCSLPTKAAGLLGTDFMDRLGAKIDFECGKLSFTGIDRVTHVNSLSSTGHVVLTVFPRGQGGRSPQVKEKEACHIYEQFSASPRTEMARTQDKCWLVIATESVTIQPRCRQIIVGRWDSDRKSNLPPLVCVEPAQIPIEGILPARRLTRVEPRSNGSSQLTSRDSCDTVTTSDTRALVMIANFSREELTIPKATVLSVAEGITEELVDKINAEDKPKSDLVNDRQRMRRNELLYRKLLLGQLDHLSEEQKQVIEPVLMKYAHVFHDEDSNDFKGTDVIEHQIVLEDTRPIRKPQYRVPYALRYEMKTQVEKMLDKNVIRESTSPWSAPAILVPKKSENGKPKFRFCVDFRALNSVNKFDTYPLPVFEETTSNLHGSKYYSVLDCYSGF